MKNIQPSSRLTRGRAAVLEALRSQPDPVGIEPLAQALARHPNTVREQLAWLLAHDLVVRVAQPSPGRGRPAWLYQARGPRPAGGEYVELAAALAWRLQDASPDTVGEARVAGHAWGADLARTHEIPRAPDELAARRQTVDLMETLGYAPTADDEAGEVVLHRCPLLQAAHRFPDVVCSVHEGMVGAVLEHGGGDPEPVRLVPFSAPGQCALHLLG